MSGRPVGPWAKTLVGDGCQLDKKHVDMPTK